MNIYSLSHPQHINYQLTNLNSPPSEYEYLSSESKQLLSLTFNGHLPNRKVIF